MKRILIVEVNWIGDVLFSTPFIRSVREAYPQSHIACLVHPRCREMLASNPRINELIIYDEEGVHRSLAGKARLVGELRTRQFDAAFILHRSFTKALLTLLAGIPTRIGYATKRRRGVLTQAVAEPVAAMHKVEYFLGIARAAGIEPRSTAYEFFVTDKENVYISGLLERNGIGPEERFVVINPGGNWDPKRWPKERFARLADALIERFGVRVVVTGAEKDVVLANEIRRLMKHAAVVLAGQTTLKQLGALLGRAALVVANDSGPMHMAVAMKTRVIALFGPTSPALTGPYGGDTYTVLFKNTQCAVPCYDTACTVHTCMSAVTVEDALRAAEGMIGIIHEH